MDTRLARRLPVHGALRAALRAPIWVYRAGLGRLFGHGALLLTHRGRKSGLLRRTVLEVVRYDPATRTHIVVAGWGPTSDWFRNIQQTPQVVVRAGGQRLAARAEILGPEEAARELSSYVRRHPIRARGLRRLMLGGGGGAPTAEDLAALARTVPVVALRPRP
jgi:deazaflavin-dependent oxidoreductase (nitroreductase family)